MKTESGLWALKGTFTVCNTINSLFKSESYRFLTNRMSEMDNRNMINLLNVQEYFHITFEFRFATASCRAENERESITNPPKAPFTKKVAK